MQTVKSVLTGFILCVCVAAVFFIVRKFKNLFSDGRGNGNADTKPADSSASVDTIDRELDGLQDAIRNAQDAISQSIGLLEKVKERQ